MEGGVFAYIFLDHPRSVGQSYGGHARFAVGVGWVCFCAAMTAFVHAVFPCLFEHNTGNAVKRLYARLEADQRPE